MYTINTIAKILGIPSVTIRAWENRYGVVKPERTEGGHRVYSEDDLRALLWLKEQVVERGIPISQAAKLLKQQVEEAKSRKSYNGTPMSFDEMIENLYRALLEYDNVKAHAYIDLSFSMFHFEDVFHKILVPILRRVGEDWHDGKVVIAQEHFVSSFAKQRILEFSRLFPVDRSLPRCVAFCPPNETHQLGLMLFAMFLQKKGIEVIYLGSNTTYQYLLEIIGEIEAEIVCISITDERYLKDAYPWMRTLLECYPRTQLGLGGLACAGIADEWKPYVLSGDLKQWDTWVEKTLTTLKKASLMEKRDES